jgi:hypothetical protein
MIAMSQFALIAAAKDPENGVDAEKPSTTSSLHVTLDCSWHDMV